MIYKSPKESIIEESALISINEITKTIMNYKIHFLEKSASTRHKTRFKFVLGRSYLGTIPMLWSEENSYFYVSLVKNSNNGLEWGDVNKTQKHQMIEISLALTEYLGPLYSDHYENNGMYGTRERLEAAIEGFKRLSKDEFDNLVKAGKVKMKV